MYLADILRINQSSVSVATSQGQICDAGIGKMEDYAWAATLLSPRLGKVDVEIKNR